MAQGNAARPDFLRTLTEGRTGRRHFWPFYAFAVVPAAGLLFAAQTESGLFDGGRLLLMAATVWVLLVAVPLGLAMARRFHDIGWHALWAVPSLSLAGAAFACALSASVPRSSAELLVCQWANAPSPFTPRGADGNGAALSAEDWKARRAETQRTCEERALSGRRLPQSRLVAFAGLATALHLASLAPLARPSDTGANRFGPPPGERGA